MGKYNNIYEEPRKILELIPGIELIEAERSRKDSFCCGGGGGRQWIEEIPGKHISLIRAQEIASINPDIVGVSCPFCTLMLEDAFKAIKGEDIQVKDIIELFNEAL